MTFLQVLEKSMNRAVEIKGKGGVSIINNECNPDWLWSVNVSGDTPTLQEINENIPISILLNSDKFAMVTYWNKAGDEPDVAQDAVKELPSVEIEKGV